ncbi:hypothetical protein [Hyphomicrobium sp. CS1BSMeth3]|uniref:hypothetical protein n=1 Tax=Hyphomicrobium sp. CS1BSMeth3 TaxID=1892844 RepID=UPI00116011AD|nr:hypothetical protein [Hyphomicrobium sp. CS1BSMeth3]
MKTSHTALMALAALLPFQASALERTATIGSEKADTIGLEMAMDAKIAALTAALNSVFHCANKDKVFTSNANKAGRDAEGCVTPPGGTPTEDLVVKMETVTESVPDIVINRDTDYYNANGQGLSQGSKGYSGTAHKTLPLSRFIDDGANAMVISLARTSFVACDGALTPHIVVDNIAQAKSGVYDCHYDSSPNRFQKITWSYRPATKDILFAIEVYQIKDFVYFYAQHRLSNIRVSYQALRVKPKSKSQ